MTTFKAFNSMLAEFFGDLADTFDEYQSVSDAKTLLTGLLAVDENTKVPMEKFVSVFSPHKDLLMAKDKKLFEVCTIPMVSESGFDISKEWETLEEDNQEAIWGYLHQLFLIGSTIQGLDSSLLSSIEGVARDCIDKVSSGEMTEEDAKNPMVIVQEIMKNKDLMKALGSNSGSEMDGGMGMLQAMMSNPDIMKSLGDQ